VSVEEGDWRLNMRMVDGRWRTTSSMRSRGSGSHAADSWTRQQAHHSPQAFGAAGSETTRHLSRSTPTVDWTQDAATK
jgi:hypothetical protein